MNTEQSLVFKSQPKEGKFLYIAVTLSHTFVLLFLDSIPFILLLGLSCVSRQQHFESNACRSLHLTWNVIRLPRCLIPLEPSTVRV